ncbi:MAG: TIGR03546 family protein [Calditrichaeota bacterium]|nr:MAG: TIGR03546 family protein [Calditrichota bacterium]
MGILRFVWDIVRILRANVSPWQVAAGFVLGMFLGLTPFWSLLNVLVVVIIIVVNVNIGSALLAYALFSLVVYLFDPWLHDLGYWLLVEVSALKPLWTAMYHAPILPYTSFNNTVYLGSLVVYLVLVVPVYVLVKKGMVAYQEKYRSRVDSWKWVKWIKATRAYKLYEKYERLKTLGE